MPRFFFDISDARVVQIDDTGCNLRGAADARMEAIMALAEIAREELPSTDHHVFIATVRNASGIEIYQARLVLDGHWVPWAEARLNRPHAAG